MSQLTTMLDLSARLRSDETPTPPATGESEAHESTASAMEVSNQNTPTRHSFAGIAGQRPLPDEPLSSDQLSEKLTDDDLERADSIHPSQQDMDDDVDMGEADADTVVDDDISENESVTSESQRPSKKKKGQRFFCTEFPPCQLSFTRSEHLARHIRKHTGERPFQCHCSRRFSRLDNLRQHAQTVHVNEEIPGDSLAATSTRFQRQIRTDRVRPSGSRSRGSTMNGGQTSTHTRGHTRNLSTSSIGSVASSVVGISDETRRRPPPLAIATDGLKRPHESSDDYGASQGDSHQHYHHHQHQHHNHYPPGMSTPTSQTFSANVGSPGYSSSFASPTSTISRSSYYNGARDSRRLSVPLGGAANLYQSTNMGYAPGYYTPMSSQASVYSQNTSGYASPTSSVVSPSRQDSESEIEYRRRTWHPSTQTNYSQRPATSGLSYHQTPDEPRPALSQQPAASQITRLPGIESFDHAASTSARHPADQMAIDTLSRPMSSTYDAGLQQGLHRLDIASNNAPSEPPWQPSHPLHGHFVPAPALAPNTQPQQVFQHHQPPHHMSMPEAPPTPRRNKRQAWYGGPVGPTTAFLQPAFTSHRPSPEDSGSSDGGGGVQTPSYTHGQEHHPTIANSNDLPLPQQRYSYIQDAQPKPLLPVRADSGLGPFGIAGSMAAMSQQAPQSQVYHLQTGRDASSGGGYMQSRPEGTHDMGRLEALVAVATSENRSVQEQR